MENKLFPILDTTDESVAVFALLLPKLQHLIEKDGRIINELLPLEKSGNKKAAEIIEYLVGRLPQYTHYKRIHHSGWREDYTTSYDFSWTDFTLQTSNQTAPVIEFEFEVKFEKDVEQSNIHKYFIAPTNCYSDISAFRTEFLMMEVEDWLKAKGFKIRRRSKRKNHIAESINVHSLKYLDGRPNPKNPDISNFNLTTHALGKCSIEIESL